MRARRLLKFSVNQTLPSGPPVICAGRAFARRSRYSKTLPSSATRPILATGDSVNHRLRSGPLAIVAGPVPCSGSGNIVIAPAIVSRPTATAPAGLAPSQAVNHRLPSGPRARPSGTHVLEIGRAHV